MLTNYKKLVNKTLFITISEKKEITILKNVWTRSTSGTS